MAGSRPAGAAGDDVLLSPACAFPAMPHGTTNRNFAAFSYAQVYSLSGSPSVVVRAGSSAEGLPIGVQIVPHHWREDVALATARQIETALGGWTCPAVPTNGRDVISAGPSARAHSI